MTTGSVCLVLFGLAAASAREPALQRFEQSEVHMGTSFGIVLYAVDEMVANHGFRRAFERIAAIDAIMSDYKSDSELTRLSESSPHPAPVPISDDLWRVLIQAQTVSQQSSGAFDVTVGPLTKLWRRSRRQQQLPPDKQLQEACAAVGFEQLRVDPNRPRAQLMKGNMRLDLGGIAQGFAATEALAVLRVAGISSALVNASGDIAVGNAPPGETGWLIGLSSLDPTSPPSHFVKIANGAVSTSGDAFQFVEINGVRYSHIVDPHTGLGLTARCSVTIIAPDCTLADAIATAVCVLGPTKGLALVEKTQGAAAFVVREADGKVVTLKSQHFEQYLVPNNQ